MALMNGKPVDAGKETVKSADAPVKTVDVKADDDKAAKKREAAKRCLDRKKKAREEQKANAIKFLDEIKKNGIYDKLSQASKDFVVGLTVEKTVASSNGGIFNVLFGEQPKVGDKVTLKDAFDKTLKGKATIDLMVKRWKEKGIEIKYNPNTTKMIESTYEIVALPKA